MAWRHLGGVASGQIDGGRLTVVPMWRGVAEWRRSLAGQRHQAQGEAPTHGGLAAGEHPEAACADELWATSPHLQLPYGRPR
uniref:Uncharacterized protein n=1 Tax=Oryza sativa subsp. japonica TaxID=39947 RepID=Q6Z8R2_ORYSJ|nr:hypothetical protein [Oryza sativa Japonica Group]